jgi:hypothetical protein
MGAVASGGVRVVNRDVVDILRIPDHLIETVAAREQREHERRELTFRDGRPAPDVRGKTVIMVDDGLATGSSMRAAAMAVRQQQPQRLVVGVPISSPETCEAFRDEVDEIMCAITPEPLYAVGIWYHDFSQTTDDEVRAAAGSGITAGSDTASPTRCRRRSSSAPAGRRYVGIVLSSASRGLEDEHARRVDVLRENQLSTTVRRYSPQWRSRHTDCSASQGMQTHSTGDVSQRTEGQGDQPQHEHRAPSTRTTITTSPITTRITR